MHRIEKFKMWQRELLFLVAMICSPLCLTLNLQAAPAIHVIGDSHAWEFNTIPNCVIHSIGPITMHRIGRDGFDILHFPSLNIQENDCVVLAFGEIDVRCHIGKHRDASQKSLDDVLDILVDNYFNTILNNRLLYNNVTVITYTVTPPTDHCDNPQFPRYGVIEDRVMIAKELNRKLIDRSLQEGIDIIDVYDNYARVDGTLIFALSDGSVHISPAYNQPIRNRLSAIILR